MLGFQRIVIAQNERGLHLYDRRLAAILEPGVYRWFDPLRRHEVQRYDLSVAEFAELNAVWLGHEPRIITRTTIAAKGDARAGMVVLDSRVAGRLGVRCRVVGEWLDDPA